MNPIARRSIVILLAVGLVGFWAARRADLKFFPRIGEPPPSPSKLESILKRKEEELSRNPNDLKSLVDRGVVYYWMGPEHYADALNSLNAARNAGAFDERIFYYSGVLYENISLFEEAQKQYERFLNHEADNREIRLRLARLLFRMGRWEESIARYQTLIDENGKDFTSVINFALAHEHAAAVVRAKKTKLTPEEESKIARFEDQAVAHLERAASGGAQLPEDVAVTLAKLYQRRKDWQKAVQIAEPELARGSNDLALMEIAAVGYENLEQYEKALGFYQKWSEAQPKSSAAKNKIKSLKKQLKIK